MLAPDSSYVHTFATTADLSSIGDYNFLFFTEMEGDQNPNNDTALSVSKPQ